MSKEIRMALAAAASSLDVEAIGSRVQRLIVDEEPAVVPDQTMLELLSATTLEILSAGVSALRFDLDHAGAGTAAAAATATYARRAAQRDIPFDLLLRAYRLGHGTFMREMMIAIARHGGNSETIGAATASVSRISFDFVDNNLADIRTIFNEELQRWNHENRAALSKLFTDFVENNGSNSEEFENTFGYDLTRNHVGLIAWSDCASLTNEHLERAFRDLISNRVAVDAGEPLFFSPDEWTCWAWIPRSGAAPFIAENFQHDERMFLAIGEPASGVAGFLRSHHQARLAQRVSLTADATRRRPVISATEIGAVGILTGDLPGLRGWVSSVLGELATDDDQTERHREVLWNFLRSNGSYSVASRRLGLHKNTAQYRVRKAKELCARDVDTSRADVEVALLSCRLLGSPVLEQTGDR